MTIEALTVNDALVLTAVRTLADHTDDASGVAVWRMLTENIGQIARSTVYSTLYLLLNGGLVRTITTKPVAKRGGRRRQVYRVTSSGSKVLAKINFSIEG